MRRKTWFGLLFVAAVFLLAVPLIVPPSGPRAPAPAPRTEGGGFSPARQTREASFKQSAIERDKAATERLSRMDSERDLRLLLSAEGKTPAGKRQALLQQTVRKHSHLISVWWKTGGQTYKADSAPAGLKRSAAPYLRKANAALARGKSYQSPAFTSGGESNFVLAIPGAKRGEGVAALVHSDIVQEVERHQKKNLRVVPYPAEGRYRLESVIPNSNRDTTVRSGEDNGNASHYAVDELVVKFRQPLTGKQLLQLRKQLQITVVRHRGTTYLFRSGKYDMAQLKAFFSKWNPVYMEPHYLYLTNEASGIDGFGDNGDTPAIVPNDTLYGRYQWNLPEIATEKGWNVTRGKNEIIVAVVDTGVQLDHPDLQGRLVPGTNIVDPSKPPEDDVGHGTHVAGIIAAQVNNNEGVAGMTWYTKIMPVKVLDSTGAGTTYSVAEGIIWATDHGANIINMSLGNYADAQFLHDAVKYAHDRGVALVAASGNDNTDRPGYPAAYPEVIAVSATDPDETRAEYSNFGDYIDVAAPGSSIASTYPGSRYAALSGTSMASPHVAGLLSLVKAANPDLTNDQMADVIRKTARDFGAAGKDADYGYGQIDVDAAVKAASAGASGGGTGSAGVRADLSGREGLGSLQLFPERVRREVRRILDKSP